MAFLANLSLRLSRLKLQDILINPDNLFYKKISSIAMVFSFWGVFLNTLISLINVTSRLPILENSTLQETKVLPASLLSSLQNLQYSYRTFNNLTETNNDFPRGHFELYIFILAQKLTEKVQLILQLLHPYTFLPTFTVIRRKMRVCT